MQNDAARKPDRYLVAGDLVARGGPQILWDEFWKKNAGGLGLGYGDPAGSAPILAAIGNHDLYDNDGSTLYSLACDTSKGGKTALDYCTMVPAYSYFGDGNSPSELRYYKDKVIVKATVAK